MLLEGIGYEAHAMFNFYFTFGGEGFNWNDGSDNLKFCWRDPRYLDALLYVNKLYREGLINIADFTDTQDQMDVNLRSEKVFCSVGPVGNSLEAGPELAKINPKMKYTAIDPILAPGVKEYKYPAWFGLGWMCPTITKDCKDPEVAMKFIEYTCTYEQQAMSYAGREGIDWKWGGSDGKSIVLIGQAKKDYDASYDAWSLKYGTRREYSFNGNQYFRDCLTWGNAIGNPERMKVIELNAKVNVDFMKYSWCFPDNGSEEKLISERVRLEIKAYAGRIMMAKSESEARSLHAEFIKKADDMGYSKTEKMATDKYKQYGPIIMDMLK
jgi:putative aldouronate transport system substrate-binding protein